MSTCDDATLRVVCGVLLTSSRSMVTSTASLTNKDPSLMYDYALAPTDNPVGCGTFPPQQSPQTFPWQPILKTLQKNLLTLLIDIIDIFNAQVVVTRALSEGKTSREDVWITSCHAARAAARQTAPLLIRRTVRAAPESRHHQSTTRRATSQVPTATPVTTGPGRARSGVEQIKPREILRPTAKRLLCGEVQWEHVSMPEVSRYGDSLTYTRWP